MKCFLMGVLTMLGVSCSSVIKDEIPKNNKDTIKDVGLLKIPEDTIDTLQEWNEIRSTLENTRKDISKILNRINELEKEVINDTIRKKINTLR